MTVDDDGSGSCAIDGSNKNLCITNVELARITAQEGLTVGSSNNGRITVDCISESSVENLGTIHLLATRCPRDLRLRTLPERNLPDVLNHIPLSGCGSHLLAHRPVSTAVGSSSPINRVIFQSGPSEFRKGIIVEASGGIYLQESVTTKASPTVLAAGTGALSIGHNKVLSTTDQALMVSADDIILNVGSSLDVGTAPLSLQCTTEDLRIGFGSGGQMTVSSVEMMRVTANGLTLGSSHCGDIEVHGMSPVYMPNVSGVVSLVATRNEAPPAHTLVSPTPDLNSSSGRLS